MTKNSPRNVFFFVSNIVILILTVYSKFKTSLVIFHQIA